jgi:phosphoglycolate phosphatase-like HAD superfamily hydrolase
MEKPLIHPTREIKDIIWDADNTIWNWVHYAAKAYPAAARHIAQKTGIPLDTVIGEMKKFYTNAGTLEDAGLIQGLAIQGLFKDLRNFNQNNLIQEIRKIFSDMRRRYLRQYPHMRETLEETHRKGINNIIVTDAPGFHAVRRIIRSKIHKSIKRVYALPSRKTSDLPKDVREKERTGQYKPPFEVIELKEEKPYTNLEQVLKLENERAVNLEYIRKHVAIVGDNDKKDMGLARIWNCLGIEALWGKAPAEELEIIAQFIDRNQGGSRNADFTSPSQIEARDNIIGAEKPENLLRILSIGQ